MLRSMAAEEGANDLAGYCTTRKSTSPPSLKSEHLCRTPAFRVAEDHICALPICAPTHTYTAVPNREGSRGKREC